MKDVFGHELEIGDTVAFMEPGYTYALKTGTIVKFTLKKLVVEWTYRTGEGTDSAPERTYKFPEQVAKDSLAGLEIKTYGEEKS